MSTDRKGRGIAGWGVWHTGPDAKGPCPQDGEWHTVERAVELNERDAEYNRAVAHARNKQWLGAEGPGRGTSAT